MNDEIRTYKMEVVSNIRPFFVYHSHCATFDNPFFPPSHCGKFSDYESF